MNMNTIQQAGGKIEYLVYIYISDYVDIVGNVIFFSLAYNVEVHVQNFTQFKMFMEMWNYVFLDKFFRLGILPLILYTFYSFLILSINSCVATLIRCNF